MNAMTARNTPPKGLTAGVSGAIRAALMGAGLLFAGAATAGPFGFDLKSSVEPSRAYGFCKELDDSLSFNFECTTAPKPHPNMSVYYLTFLKGIGVCDVRGASSYIPDNESGSDLRFYTDLIADQLKRKYGQWGHKYDEMNNDSIFSQPSSSWMSQLEKGERDYIYIWRSWDLPPEYRSSIYGITLGAMAEDSKTGWFYVDFITPLDDACQKAMSDVF